MIDFSNASLLGYNHESRFLGESAFQFGVSKSFTVEGFIDNLMNTNGVSGTMSGVRSFLASANDWQPIILKGINFGTGRVNSISFNEGNWVKMTNYTANLIVLDSGNLYNMTGEYYSSLQDNLNSPINRLDLLDELTETFDFNLGSNNEYSYDHSLTIKFLSGDATNPITRAKNLATGFMRNPVPFGFITAQYSGFYNTNGKRYYTESINHIDFTYSVRERFSMDQLSGNYSIRLTHNINTDEQGITQVSENGQIKGLDRLNPYGAATSGYEIESTKSYPRCLDVFYYYMPSGAYTLTNQFIQNGSELNSFAGTVSYNVVFTNDPSIFTGYRWTYTNVLDRDSDQVYNVSENGQILGFGKVGSPEKFNRAIEGYSIVKTGIFSRCSGMYFGVPYATKLWEINKTERRAPYQGSIDYSKQYSDDPDFIDDPIILRVRSAVEKTKPLYIYEPYNIFNNKEIVQNGGQTSPAIDAVTYNVSVKPDIQMSDSTINYCLNYCLGRISGLKSNIGSTDKYVADLSYSINELDKKFNLTASINYYTGVPLDNLDLNWP